MILVWNVSGLYSTSYKNLLILNGPGPQRQKPFRRVSAELSKKFEFASAFAFEIKSGLLHNVNIMRVLKCTQIHARHTFNSVLTQKVHVKIRILKNKKKSRYLYEIPEIPMGGIWKSDSLCYLHDISRYSWPDIELFIFRLGWGPILDVLPFMLYGDFRVSSWVLF